MRALSIIMRDLIAVMFLIGWLAGVVIAKGFWSVLFACVCPAWAWYLLVERLLQLCKIV